MTGAFDVEKVRERFPGLARRKGGRAAIFLDNPAGTQVPSSVAAAMRDALLHHNANLGGYFDTSEEAGAMAADAHHAAATFVNAQDEGEVFFGQSMTALTFALSRSLGAGFAAGDELVLTRMDHDANVAPWLLLAGDLGLTIRWLDFDTQSFEFDLEALRALMSDRTRLVAVCLASNASGTINDVAEIARIARAAGALVFVDAVQFAPHDIVDVQALGCDFLVCSVYKFYGPHCAFAWGRRALLESMKAYKVRPAPDELPWRHSLGTASLEMLAGTRAAIEYIAAIGDEAAGPAATLRARLQNGYAAMRRQDDALCRQLLDGLQAIAGSRILGIGDSAAIDRRVATVSFVVEGHAPGDIARALARDGIQVWSGHNYAVEFYRRLGLLDRGGAVRIGPVHYNTAEEIERTLVALDAIAAGRNSTASISIG